MTPMTSVVRYRPMELSFARASRPTRITRRAAPEPLGVAASIIGITGPRPGAGTAQRE